MGLLLSETFLWSNRSTTWITTSSVTLKVQGIEKGFAWTEWFSDIFRHYMVYVDRDLCFRAYNSKYSFKSKDSSWKAWFPKYFLNFYSKNFHRAVDWSLQLIQIHIKFDARWTLWSQRIVFRLSNLNELSHSKETIDIGTEIDLRLIINAHLMVFNPGRVSVENSIWYFPLDDILKISKRFEHRFKAHWIEGALKLFKEGLPQNSENEFPWYFPVTFW